MRYRSDELALLLMAVRSCDSAVSTAFIVIVRCNLQRRLLAGTDRTQHKTFEYAQDGIDIKVGGRVAAGPRPRLLLKMTLLKLLELLAHNAAPGDSSPAIAKAVGSNWIDDDERHLGQLVSRLRRRWQSHTGEKLPLRTEHGHDYSFCVDIEVL